MISVIIPLYNAEESILAALDSVKHQIGEEYFEMIIINDGSTDTSKNLVEHYLQENPSMDIKFLHQENKGVSAARNRGLEIAKGDYIAFLDADDVWLPEKTQKQLHYLRNSSLEIDFITSLRNQEKIGFPYKADTILVDITLKKLLIKVVGQTSTALFRRKILENTGFFDESQKYSEDANYWMKIAEKNKMVLLKESLVITGNGKKSFGEKGLSANLKEMEKGIQKNINEMYQRENITTIEYIFFRIFSKIKYGLRKIR